MGHTVHPRGARQGLFPLRVPSSVMATTCGLGLFRGEDNYSPVVNGTCGLVSEQYLKFAGVEKILVSFFERSGYVVNSCRVKETSYGSVVYLDMFQRQRTSRGVILRSKRFSRGKPLSRGGASSSGGRRRVTWTSRRQMKWRPLSVADVRFLQRTLEKQFNLGGTVKIKGRLLGKSFSEDLQRSLMFMKRESFFSDGLILLSLAGSEPVAQLFSKFMSLELKETSRHRTLLSFIFNGLGEVLKLPGVTLKGCRVQVKGRVDRSARATVQECRLGSMPLQTLSAKVDYSYSEVVTKYGVCSVKVWFCYS